MHRRQARAALAGKQPATSILNSPIPTSRSQAQDSTTRVSIVKVPQREGKARPSCWTKKVAEEVRILREVAERLRDEEGMS